MPLTRDASKRGDATDERGHVYHQSSSLKPAEVRIRTAGLAEMGKRSQPHASRGSRGRSRPRPHSGEVGRQLCETGTVTLTVFVDVLPEPSPHATLIVYTRPVSVPERSARSCSVRLPVIV
jgi:hypothetical protein